MDTRFAKSAYRYFAIWGILTSMAMTVSTVVDALMIGNLIGSDGLAVTNLSTPVFLTFALFGIMLGVGAGVRIGRALGASEIEEANRVFHSLVGVGLLVGVICWLPLTFRNAFFGFLGATEEMKPLVRDYLTVVLWSAPVFVLYHILSIAVRTDSDPRLAAAASAVVIVANLLFDLLFMMILKWGILGASASLCIAECLGIIVLLQHFRKKRALLRLNMSLPKLRELGSFAANGFGMGSAYIFQAVSMLFFNNLLVRYGQANAAIYVAIFGVIYSASMLPFAFYDGASNALSTITSFFLGEADHDGIYTVLRQALYLVLIAGVVIALACFFFARQIAGLFGLPPELASGTAARAIRVFSVSILFTGVNTLITAFWQTIGRASLAGAMSLLRNLLLIMVIGFGLIARNQIIGLSFAYICTEMLCTILILIVRAVSGSRAYLRKAHTPPERVFENQYIIQTDSMEQISGDLDRIGEEWEIPMKKTLIINFICEELLLNIIKFGLEDAKKEHYIAIKLMEQDDEFILRIRDNVRSFNPFETEGDAIDNGVLTLIQKKSKRYDYQRKMIFNYLYMVI